MKQLLTHAIILNRTDYGEADRIITLLTPDYGKLRLIAKGVRKVKSKLAGGIELFSVSHISFIQGRNEVGTLVSTRLINHYGNIVKNLERTQLGYELIKMLDKNTEDEPEADYFHLLQRAFEALNDPNVNASLIRTWFQAQMILLAGHKPNLNSDAAGSTLDAAAKYMLDLNAMTLARVPNGSLAASHIKLLRLLFGSTEPRVLNQIADLEKLLKLAAPLIRTMVQTYLRT